MGRYFQTADYKPTIDFLYEPDWALTERVLKTEQDSLDAQRAQLEAVKNLEIQHLGGAADAENAKRILDYYRNMADEYSNAIESNKLDARAYNPNLKNLQNDITKNYREGEIAGIQSSVLRKQAWEKEHEKFKETNPEYYNHARSKFMADYISSGGNSLVRGWQGEGLARPIDVEKVTQHAYKLMAEKTGWTRDSTNGTWINSNGQKVEKLEANRVFQNIMGTILADPANQAFMRQSTRLGYMRYLDDNGNIDYKSPGLNPFSSIAQSISYENRQDDHSMRADDYGKMNFQHELDKKMENHKSNLRRKEEKEKWERENPPEDASVASLKDSPYQTEEDFKEALNSDNHEERGKALAILTTITSEHLSKFLDPIRDKDVYDKVMTRVVKNGITTNLGDVYQQVINEDYKGVYIPQRDRDRYIEQNNQKMTTLSNELYEANKKLKNGQMTKAQYAKEEARIKYQQKEIVKDTGNIMNNKIPKSEQYNTGFWDNVLTGNNEDARKRRIGTYNGSEHVIKSLKEIDNNYIANRHNNNTGVYTFTALDKRTANTVKSSMMGTHGALLIYNEDKDLWEEAPKNSITDYDVKGYASMTGDGSSAYRLVNKKGEHLIVKANKNNPYSAHNMNITASNSISKNDMESYVKQDPRYKEMAAFFGSQTPNKGAISYVTKFELSSKGKVYAVTTGPDGSYSVNEMPGKITDYNYVNDYSKNKQLYDSGSKTKNITEIVLHLNNN